MAQVTSVISGIASAQSKSQITPPVGSKFCATVLVRSVFRIPPGQSPVS